MRAMAADTLDAVTRSITKGQLVMPRVSAPSQQTVLHNHPSWENDDDAKRALRTVSAKWLARVSCIVACVARDDRPAVLRSCTQGLCTVPRTLASSIFILYPDWGVTYIPQRHSSAAR